MVQSQQNYIGINGIVTQDLNSINAELESYFKSVYGENINLESNTSDGQWLNILAQQKIDALDFQVQLYNNLDVDSVVGLPQQVLYKLNGLTIKDFTYSFVYVNVTVSQNVSLSGLDGDIANTDGTGYTVTDINGNNWILAESISLVASGMPYLLLFRAQELGQITALANTITNMSTIVAGVTEVNNPANNFITGQTGESAAEFRTRRNRSMQAPSQGFKESIEGQLLALNDVSDAKVYDNKDDENIDGVQVIVQGGTSNEIGNIIYNNLPPGINTQGAYEATITVNNRNKVLNYDKPNPIPILVKGTIESLTGNYNDVDLDCVKQTLASKQFNIGEIAESANITTELKNILGETGSPYDIELSLGATGGEWDDITSVGGNTYNSAFYDGTTYVFVGDNGVISKTSDLETFTTVTVTPTLSSPQYTFNWHTVKKLNGFWIALGDLIDTGIGGVIEGYISTSSDATTWATPYRIKVGSSYYYPLTDITYGSGKYVITTWYGNILKSTDLTTWSVSSVYPTSYRTHWESILYDGSQFVMLGRLGDEQNKLVLATSEELAGWNFINPNVNSGGSVSIYYKLFYLNNMYFMLGSNGYVTYSQDLVDFTATQVGNLIWNGMSYLNNLYVFVGGNGNITMTQDLINWTTIQKGGNYWYSALSNNSKFIVVGTGYTTYTIPEISWEEILTPTGLADFFVMTVDGMKDLTVLGAD